MAGRGYFKITGYQADFAKMIERSKSRYEITTRLRVSPLRTSERRQRPATSQYIARPASKEVIHCEFRDTVILVHGLGQTTLGMMLLERRLKRQGYAVVRWGYRSWWGSLLNHAARLREEINKRLASTQTGKVHFVGHSMGSIVIRKALSECDFRTDSVGWCCWDRRTAVPRPPGHGLI